MQGGFGGFGFASGSLREPPKNFQGSLGKGTTHIPKPQVSGVLA